jgi:hypothetical protein
MPEGVGYGPQNTASTGINLNIIADKAYCFTGNHAVNTAAVEAMKFTTGSYIFVGECQANMGIQNAAVGSASAVTFCQIEFNGTIVSHIVAGLTGSDALTSVTQGLVIPPYTEVIVKLYSNENEATRFMTASITGRVYK